LVGALHGKKKARKTGSSVRLDRARERNAAALDSHSDALMVAARATVALSRKQILAVLAQHWVPQRPGDVLETDPLSNYLTGSPGYIANYYTVLNSLFAGLNLTRSDMTGLSPSSKVSNMIDVIARGLSRSARAN
jgi:hypothetical protein